MHTHPRRLTPLASPDQREIARKLDARIEVDGSCWVYVGAHDQDGYAIVWHGDRARRAHRLAYEIAHGPIPAGLHIDHVWLRGCRNRACLRPDHLEAVSQRENNRRSADKRRILRLVEAVAA